MILSYILTFSLLVMSVIKVTDLFITKDRELTKKHQEFIQSTKKKHQDGNITLMAALLTLIISAFFMFLALKFKVELKEARYRKDSYLCFKYLNVETENYIADITKFNWALRTAFGAAIAGTPGAEAAFLALKIARNGRHFYYIKNLLSNSYCKEKLPAFSYLKNVPYKTTLAYLLVTNPDATTQVKEAKWNVTYYKDPAGIRSKKSFYLKAEMSIEGAFVPNFQLKTSEVSMADFSKLK